MPEALITMFKFETVVHISLIATLALPIFTFADNSTAAVTTLGDPCEGETKIFTEAQAKLDEAQDHQDPKLIERWTPRLQAAQERLDTCRANQTKSGADCENKSEQFNTALKDFATACGDANMGGDCAKEVAKCMGTNKKDEDPDDDRPARSRSRDKDQPYDVDGVKKQCPAAAGEDIDKLKTELKEQKEKVKKLQDELPKIEEEANTKQSTNNDKLTQLEKEMGDAQEKMGEDMQKISEEQQGAEKAITDQVTAIAVQIAKARDAIREVSLTNLQGLMERKRAKTQTDLNCHASALAQISKMQNDVSEGIRSGTYNGGNFTNLMKNVGLSDRQRWQKIANKYYHWCLESKATKDSKAIANDAYNLLVEKSEKAKVSFGEQIKQLQAQQNQLMTPQACAQMAMQMNGSSAGGSELCKAARKAQQKSQKLERDFLERQQRASKKYTQLAQEGERNIQTLRNKYLTKQREAGEEKSRLDNLQNYLEAKYQRSHRTSTVDGKGLAKAKGLASQTESAALMLIKCEKLRAAKQNQSFECSGGCTSAQTFLRNFYGDESWESPAVTNSDQTYKGNHSLAIPNALEGTGPTPAATPTGDTSRSK